MHLFNFNPIVSRLIQSYQQKICYYDKQQWEQRSTEDQILSKTENVVPPTSSTAEQGQKSSVSAKSGATIATNTTNQTTTDLIDLDLISGSAYTMKSKSNQGWISMLFQAVLRVLFFPLYLKWWSEQTSSQLVGLLLCLYILQIFAIRIYYQKTFALSSSSNNGTIASSSSSSSSSTYSNKSDFTVEISPTEIFMPVAMMVVLGIIHTQIVGTKNYIKSSFSSSTSSASSLSSNSASSMFHSNRNRKNSSQHTKDVSQHTDCSSSSSASSTSSSVDSSPVADVRMRIQNRITRLEKFKQQGDVTDSIGKSSLHIPKIRFYHESDSPKVFLIDDMDDIDDQHMKRFKENTHFPPNNCFRRRSDSMPKLSSSAWTLKKPRKPRAKAQNSKLTPPLKLSSSWNNCDDDNENYSPISIRSSLYGSSFDSEGTISPMTSTNYRSEPVQWSRKHSDIGTSDVDDDDDQSEHTAKIKHASSLYENRSKLVKSNSTPEKNHHSLIDPEKSAKMKAMSVEDIAPVNCELNSMNLAAPSNELKVSCSLWQYNVCQKIDLSVADISSAIIRKVETVEHSTEYIWLGIILSMIVALIPSIYRMQFSSKEAPNIANILGPNHNSSTPPHSNPSAPLPSSDIDHLADLHELIIFFLDEAFVLSKNSKIRLVVIIVMIERFFLSLLYFFLLCVTERTFKQRFLYSKYFSHITRRDRAKRSQVPHFRLHKVRNLKVWLSVRSYLRRYGPHRSVDTICSTTFIISICLLTCISLQILRDSNESCFSRLICWEMIFWSLALGIYIMRLMILGSRINQKYRSNLSVLIAEQINLYLQLECKPHKKDALMLANQVLKLAVDLLKELESPYKISGFSANPYLYNITKVVVLSAFSAVLTEMLGFKLKLYKIKLIR